MSIFENLDIFLVFLCSVIFVYFLRYRSWRKIRSSAPINWPVVGMLPAVLKNMHRIHEYMTEILVESGGSFEFKGPWFCNMDMFFTCYHLNVHHIFSKYFSNYPKGIEFREIFEVLGDGIFNADFTLWELHRRTTLSVLTQARFYSSLEKTIWEKVETSLMPVLDGLAEKRVEFDLQDVFQRFTFDGICKLVLNYDPGSLRRELPEIACEKGLNDALEALLHRHILPRRIWKLQKWLRIGSEKKLVDAWKAFDEFLYPCVSSFLKNEDNGDDDCDCGGNDGDGEFNFLRGFKDLYIKNNADFSSNTDLETFLRDTSLNLMVAGRDTTSTCLTWLFWLVSENPNTETKILQEIEEELKTTNGGKWRKFTSQESHKLVYLHGALCESLRLFPPVALEHKAPIQEDSLPSSHHLPPNKKVIVSFYSMGRMETVWGKDCLEFKPERWITDRGGIKHEPSYKFPAFNAGPRTCLGKEMAFIQMKFIAASIIFHYKIELVKGELVCPRDSVIIQAKNGLWVRFSRRNGF